MAEVYKFSGYLLVAEITYQMIAILFALEIEAGGTIDLLRGKTTLRSKSLTVHRGRLGEGDDEVLLGILGTGKVRAREAAWAMLRAHRPDRVILAGFSGGLQPSLERLDIVVVDANEVKLVLHGADENAPTVFPKERFGPVGPILTVEKVIHSAEEKRRLGKQTGALVADMESDSVRQVCEELDVPFSNVRIVIDAMDEELPADVQHLTDQPTLAARLGAAIGTIWRRPSSFKEMIHLRENAIESSDRLARFLVEYAQQKR